MREPKFSVWQPDENILKGDGIYHHQIIDNENGLIISLTDQFGSKVNITYNELSKHIGNYVWSYRFTNEICMQFMVDVLDEAEKRVIQNGMKFEKDAFWFYKSQDSEYIKGFSKEIESSINSVPEMEVHIFRIVGGFIEVISDYNPEIVIVTSLK
ncbi:hypothetical protein [Bacillus suaedae]|uniref:Uncharacterized protein n=1 Tax=Halalkalibacter suaedae TaxID=2822140 RepID=A0A941AQH6_9BACI|nr:hypothetical protein [Bacillus suaedae]MBP3952811.1 hypothetical protein [Bacillus suaedae]